MKLQIGSAYGAKVITLPLALCRFTRKNYPTPSTSVLDCGDKSPQSKTQHVTSFQSADMSTHSKMLIRTAIITVLLAIVSACLFGYILHSQSGIFREYQAAWLSVEWMLLACIAVWCATFLFLTFSLNDLPLIGLLLIAITTYFIGYAAASQAADAIILLAGVTLGRGAGFLLKAKAETNWKSEPL